jgi:hypothetical protein
MHTLVSRPTQADVLRERFEHAFQRLSDEIGSYPNDWKIWIKEGDIRSSAGNLSVFLVQLVQQTAVLLSGKAQSANSPEPSKFLSREELMEKVEIARQSIMDSIADVQDDSLDQDFPVPFKSKPVSASTYLAYLLTEIYFHLGQINYHRKLV